MLNCAKTVPPVKLRQLWEARRALLLKARKMPRKERAPFVILAANLGIAMNDNDPGLLGLIAAQAARIERRKAPRSNKLLVRPKLWNSPGVRLHLRVADSWSATWQCRADLAKKGYPGQKSVRLLIIGEVPTDEQRAIISERAHALQSELMMWAKTGEHRKRDISQSGFTYFIHDDRAIKVGTAYDVSRRLYELQISTPKPLEVIAYVPAEIAMERVVHKKFKHLRIRGEWFRDVPELRQFIAEMVAKAKLG